MAARYRTATDFARAIEAHEVTYRAHESGGRGINRAAAEMYARHLNVSAAYLLFGSEDEEGQSGRGSPHADGTDAAIDAVPFDPEQIRPGAELVGEKDLPIYASAEGGPYGMTISYDPIDYVKRPEPLMKVKGAFGFYVVGDSMAPRYEPGDLLLVHPSKPPVRNDYVLVLLRDGLDGQVDAIVKRFLGWDGDKLRLDQFNPPGEIKPIPRDRVHNLHLVVGSYGRRG